jgi:hypothetical protein
MLGRGYEGNRTAGREQYGHHPDGRQRNRSHGKYSCICYYNSSLPIASNLAGPVAVTLRGVLPRKYLEFLITTAHQSTFLDHRLQVEFRSI